MFLYELCVYTWKRKRHEILVFKVFYGLRFSKLCFDHCCSSGQHLTVIGLLSVAVQWTVFISKLCFSLFFFFFQHLSANPADSTSHNGAAGEHRRLHSRWRAVWVSSRWCRKMMSYSDVPVVLYRGVDTVEIVLLYTSLVQIVCRHWSKTFSEFPVFKAGPPPPWFEFLVIFDFFAPWYRRGWEASSVKIL